jgi:predicted nuclease of predicted toxin-antitoxin system
VTAPPAPRFLIDENLSPLLAEPARARGFEATHVNHLGLRAEADWGLLRVVAAQDWVLVTNNAIEFRGRYREIELHPGVVFLLPSVRRRAQLELFGAALDWVRESPDLVNTTLDVRFDGEGRPVVTPYRLP